LPFGTTRKDGAEGIDKGRFGMRLKGCFRTVLGLLMLCQVVYGAPDPEIEALVEQISRDRLGTTVRRMVGFETRFIGSDSNAAAARWLGEHLQALGYQEVRFDTFLVDADRVYRVNSDSGEQFHRFLFQGEEQWNVVVTKPGTLHPEQKVVLGGHYDSISIDRSQERQDVAPGADDNGSGVAALLEIARVLQGADLEVTVEFVFFGAEELGLVGSRDFVDRARERGDQILLMLQLDAIGTRSTVFPDVFTLDTIHPYRELGEVVAQAAKDYTDLRASDGVGGRVLITNRGCRCSDHQSFIDRGYPGVGVFQYTRNPATHVNTSVDTLSQVDLSLVEGIAKAVLAAVAQMGGFPGLSPDFEGNGQVGLEDFVIFVQAFGRTDVRFDLDRNGRVGFSDFVIFAKNFGRRLD